MEMNELSNYERELCQPKNPMLYNVVLNAARESGCYYNKAGDKTYALFMSDDNHNYLITACLRDEEDNVYVYSTVFIDGILDGDEYMQCPELLPKECPAIFDAPNPDEKYPFTLMGFNIEDMKIVTYFRGKYYTSIMDETFDYTGMSSWASFALNFVMSLDEPIR